MIAATMAVGVAAVGGGAAQGVGPAETDATAAPRAAGAVTVVAAGDIACAAGGVPRLKSCRQADTAALTRRLHPDAVLALGDLQYDLGTLRDFRLSYDLTWGTFKDITSPIPGNH